MSAAAVRRHALVFGATGFLGRWLVVELLGQGVRVSVAVRTEESGRRLDEWLADHRVVEPPQTLLVDFEAEDLGLDASALADVTEVHNLAGAFRFGMTAEEARRGNVTSARRIVELAARLDGRPHLVHVSGYRVGSHGVPVADDSAYSRLGAYEASKIEADAVVQQTATRLGVPFTIVNPSTVSGVSTTGESDQYLGLATSLRDLWHGRLAALPGNDDVFVPVVPVDHLARFMALVPTVPEAAGKSYWVLDDDTPPLPSLLTEIGRHYQVGVPRLRLPVRLVKSLPSRLTKADPETLSFMSTERYPTAPADALAREHGLSMPATLPAIRRWADHLAAHRFGDPVVGGAARGFASYAGVRTFGLGDDTARTVVLPAIPVNADTWAETAAALTEPTRVVDLPGLGMSAGSEHDWPAWLAGLAADGDPLHLVGHSIGAAVATEFAAARPDRVSRLTLVAPAFLQPAGGVTRRLAPLTAAYLRRVGAPALARMLLGSDELAPALETSVSDLRRPGVARRVGSILAAGARARRRELLRRQLVAFPGEVHVVVGEHDPLAPDALTALGDHVRVTVIPGAGHHPQLTHRAQLVEAIGRRAAPVPSDR